MMTYCRNVRPDVLLSLKGSKVHFMSDCKLFPEFDITGKVTSASYNGYETVFEVMMPNRRTVTVGSNMDGLRYEVL